MCEDFGAGGGCPRQGWVIASHSILWDAVICPCLRCVLLAPESSLYGNIGSSYWPRRHHQRWRMLSRCGAAGYGGVAATDIDLCCVIRNIPYDGCWVPDDKWIDLVPGSRSAPVGWPTVHRPERKGICIFLSGWCIVGCLMGMLWDGWDWSIAITVWQICPNWCVVLKILIFVCIRFHAIFVSCDSIMKWIYIWTQVVNKLLLLKQYFTNIAAIQNMALGIITNLTTKSMGHITDIYVKIPHMVQWCMHVVMSTYGFDLQDTQILFSSVHLINWYVYVSLPYPNLYMHTFTSTFLCTITVPQL